MIPATQWHRQNLGSGLSIWSLFSFYYPGLLLTQWPPQGRPWYIRSCEVVTDMPTASLGTVHAGLTSHPVLFTPRCFHSGLSRQEAAPDLEVSVPSQIWAVESPGLDLRPAGYLTCPGLSFFVCKMDAIPSRSEVLEGDSEA